MLQLLARRVPQNAVNHAAFKAFRTATNSSSDEMPTTAFVRAALDQLDYKEALVKSILHPDREFTVNLALQMENGEVRTCAYQSMERTVSAGSALG